MYTGIPICQFTGFYRLLPVRDFSKYVGWGLAFDLFSTIGLFVLMAFNNALLMKAESSAENLQLQHLTVSFKFVLLIEIALEVLIFVFEYFKKI
jgi:hypothetical protein